MSLVLFNGISPLKSTDINNGREYSVESSSILRSGFSSTINSISLNVIFEIILPSIPEILNSWSIAELTAELIVETKIFLK